MIPSFLESPIEKEFKIRSNDESIYPQSSTTIKSLYERYDQLNASQRRHAFGAYKTNFRRSNTSDPRKLYPDTPTCDTNKGQIGEYDRLHAGSTFNSELFQDPTSLTVPSSSDVGHRGNPYYRHHSYDVPLRPSAPDDEETV